MVDVYVDVSAMGQALSLNKLTLLAQESTGGEGDVRWKTTEVVEENLRCLYRNWRT